MRGFIFLLLLGWMAGCTWYYTCVLRHDCGCQTEKVAFNAPSFSVSDGDFSAESTDNFTFNMNTDKETIPPATDAMFGKLASYLSSGLRNTNVIGLYRSDENGGEALGLKRAEKIKGLLVSKGANGDFITTSAKQEDVPANDDLVYGAIDFGFSQNEVKAKELLVSGTSVHFITGSNDLEMTPEIKTYMRNLEEYFTTGDHSEKIHLVGHTDNVGDRNANITLSKQRAEDVKAKLVSHGVKAEIISTDGKGPDVPVASNDTEDGKAQNRRVDIKITE